MAQAPKESGGDGANFIRQIVSDPKNVPDVMLLTGYIGASSEEAHERLYLSPDLANYVEIPRAAILHQASLPKEQDAHGGVTLWVKKDAALQYKMAPAAQALANYFAGAIQAGAQGAGGGAQARPHGTVGVCGHVTQHNCPTFNCSVHCQTEITPCLNTHAVTCNCPVTVGCQTNACSQAACTFIGCGHSLACTEGLLCAGAAAGAAPQARTIADCRSFVDCSMVCPTRIGPCLSNQFTCAPCVTQHPAQCTFGCTHPPQCVLETVGPPCATRNVVQCSFVCTQPQQCVLETVGPQCVTRNVVQCSLVCTQPPQCFSVGNPACHNTSPIFCPIATGQACPQGFPGQPGQGGQVAQQRAWSFAQCTEAMCGVHTNRCPETFRTPCWQ